MDNLSRMLADIDELANDPDPQMRPTPYAVNLAKELLVETARLMGSNLPLGTPMVDGAAIERPMSSEEVQGE